AQPSLWSAPAATGPTTHAPIAQNQNKTAIQAASVPHTEVATRTLSNPDMTAQTVREKLLDLLSFTPIPVDDLVRHCQFSASAVLTVLTELELSGSLDSLPGGRVVRAASHGENG
ncbi:MAG: DNA-protecting protein DprA, partial [Acetobacter orientalis]